MGTMKTDLEKKLELRVASLRRAVRNMLQPIVRVHNAPLGATRRCPDHVNHSQSGLCKAIAEGRKALKDD